MAVLQGTTGIVLLGTGLGLALLGLEAAELQVGLGGVTTLVSLVPVAVSVVLGGARAAAAAALVALAGIGLAAGASAGAVMALRHVLPGLVLGVALRQRLHLGAGLVLVGGASALGLLLLLRAYAPPGTTLLGLLAAQLEAHVTELDRLSGLLGVGRDPAWVTESTRLLAIAVRLAGPALFAVGLLLVALTNCIVARLCLRGRGFRAFADEAVPDHLVWGVIAAGVMLASQHEAIERAGTNLLIVLGFLYAIQGLAVLRHFFQKARVPRPLQGVSFGLFALQPLLLILAACLGLSDLWVDFRKIRRAATPA